MISFRCEFHRAWWWMTRGVFKRMSWDVCTVCVLVLTCRKNESNESIIYLLLSIIRFNKGLHARIDLQYQNTLEMKLWRQIRETKDCMQDPTYRYGILSEHTRDEAVTSDTWNKRLHAGSDLPYSTCTLSEHTKNLRWEAVTSDNNLSARDVSVCMSPSSVPYVSVLFLDAAIDYHKLNSRVSRPKGPHEGKRDWLRGHSWLIIKNSV